MARENARRAPASASDSRFEFARAHVVKQQVLEDKLEKALRARYEWEHGGNGNPYRIQMRRPRTAEERAEFKALEAAIVDAKTRLLLHDNDGRKL